MGNSLRAAFPVVATAEVLFQPDIKADEEVATAHLFDLEFRGAGAPIAPGDWNHRPTKPPDDGLQRQLHRQIEMGGD